MKNEGRAEQEEKQPYTRKYGFSYEATSSEPSVGQHLRDRLRNEPQKVDGVAKSVWLDVSKRAEERRSGRIVGKAVATTTELEAKRSSPGIVDSCQRSKKVYVGTDTVDGVRASGWHWFPLGLERFAGE
ncbi:unnamed protein product, partial [Prorocentrum cordatum]